MSVNSSKWGAKIGPRIAMLVSQAMIHTHTKLAALRHKVAMTIFHAISDEISEEVDTMVGPLLAKIHEAIDESHPAYPAVHFLHTATGQLKALAGTGLSMSGLLSSVANIMNNELAPVVYTFIQSNPHLIPPTSDLAQMAAGRFIGPDLASSAMAANGIDQGWADAYMQAAQVWPGASEVISLMQQGHINSNTAATWLARTGMPDEVIQPWLGLAQTPISAADAALAVLRGNMSRRDGELIAVKWGVSPADFAVIMDNTGEPPGTMQLLEAYRRGFIDKATLEKGILQSRVRDEWIPMLEKLRFEPMSVADAVNAVVQNHMSADDAARIAEENGLTPGAVDILTETAGEPLSRTEMEQLYNRGLVTREEVIQALRESRLKNKYNDFAFDLHQRLLPVGSIQHALRYGTISDSDAVKGMMVQGYSQKDSATLVTAGSAERIYTYKNRVISAVGDLYENSVISLNAASGIITSLGHSQTEAAFILQSFDFRRNARLVSQVTSVLKSKYLSRHITRTQVVNELNAIGISASQRDQLLKEWDIEHDANTKILTPAQVVKAVKLKLITPEAGVERLMYDGYNKDDATLLIKGA